MNLVHLQPHTSRQGPTFYPPKVLVKQLFLLMLCLVALAQAMQAQDYDHYVSLKCANPVPEELRTSSSSKYQAEIAKLGNNEDSKAQKEFLLQSNFVLDEMLLSGKVIFNDPVTEYVTRVKDVILASRPDLQKKVKIYVVKSPVVNAFATNSGALLVNMGLLAHLQNEAQLAFVLCHEIQHYIKKHPINGYVNASKLRKNFKSLGLKTQGDLLAERNKYSREQEQEADDLGYELYKASGYALSDAIGVFDVLGTAHLPYDQLPWNFDFFEFDFLRFPEYYHRTKLDSIDRHEEEADSLSTHPNIAKRRQSLIKKVAASGADKGETFLVGAGPFLEMRKMCRFELCDLFMGYHVYELSLYNALLLQAEEPQSPYLHKVIAQSIYGLASHKNMSKFWAIHLDAEEGEGELQQLLHFTERSNDDLFTMIALRHCWKTYLQYPEDQELKAIAEDMLYQFFDQHAETANWVERELPTAMPALVDSIMQVRKLGPQRADIVADSLAAIARAEEAKEQQAKADKEDDFDERGRKKKNAKVVNESVSKEHQKFAKDRLPWSKWAICDLFKEEKFLEAWERVRKSNKTKPSEAEGTDYYVLGGVNDPAEGVNLGIDKIVLLQPVYKRVDMLDKLPVKYLESEQGLDEFRDMVTDVAKRNKVETKFLETRNLKATDAEVINDVATMMQWVSEYVNAEGKVSMVNFKQDDANAMVKKYGTPYFGWNGVMQVRDKLSPEDKAGYLLLGIIVWPLLPVAIIGSQLPHNKTYCVSVVFDVQKGETLMEQTRIFRAKDRKRFVKSTLYDTFFQIKSKPKKKKKK
jgi:beta-barrel assembly-enhancing protease